METSRDDTARTCAQCGTHIPARAGGGRRADYCSRSCQAKAYRSRHAHGSARDDSQWSALTARAVAAEAEAASLREQLAAMQRRVDELAGKLAAARTTEDTAGARQEQPETPAAAPPGMPALPPLIKANGVQRHEPTGASSWDVYVDDVPIGNIKLLSGKYWPTLPNGFEVYMGGNSTDLDDATHKLVMAYTGWSRYWHVESAATLTRLRPQRDGARTVRWGGLPIGKVAPATSTGYGGEGVIAITPKDGVLRGRQGPARFADEQQAADALLERWQAEHAPPFGGLVR